jgi:transcription-repair coupling factor (superfamily II helicase)
MRINIYQQLSGSQTLGEIGEIQQMLSDRFGPLPPSVMTLLMLMQIKIMAGRLESSRVTFGPDGVLTIVFSGTQEQIKDSLKRLFDLTQYHFEVLYEQPLRLKTTLVSSSSSQRLAECVALLGRVASDTPA